MLALRMAGLGLLVALGGCSTLHEASFVSDDPVVADVLDGEVEMEGPWVTGHGERVIWSQRM